MNSEKTYHSCESAQESYKYLKKEDFYNLTHCLIPMSLSYLTGKHVEIPLTHFFPPFINKCLTVQLSKKQYVPCPTIPGKYTVDIKLRNIRGIHMALSEHI